MSILCVLIGVCSVSNEMNKTNREISRMNSSMGEMVSRISDIEEMMTTTTVVTTEATTVVTEPLNLYNPDLDFKHKSNISKEELEKGLMHNLKPLAQTFVDIENEYGINAVLFSSMVALESGWGTSPISQNNNNITSCVDASSPNGYKYYPSKEACLYHMAELLTDNYFSADGMYYHNSTKLEDISCYYLLGKSMDKMSSYEKHLQHEYVNMISEIHREIIDRIER